MILMNEETQIRKIRIIQIIPETARAKTFVFEFVDGEEAAYKAGQFITLIFAGIHGEKRRSYSLSSSPDLGEQPRFTVAEVENGEFSRVLISNAKPGDLIDTAGIHGLFTLPENPDSIGQYFFFAAGSGIAPCFSLIKTLLLKTACRIVLVYSNRSEESCIFYSELRQLEKQYHQRFKVHYLFSNIFDVRKSRLSKWLLEQLLAEYLAVEPQNALFYLCGPFEYMRMITITLRERVPARNILKENFNSLPHLIIPRPPDVGAHKAIIRLGNSQHILAVQYPVSILGAAKRAGLALPYSCEAGRCGSCVALCTKGKVWMAYNEVLLEEDIQKGKVLLCQAYPVGGDVEIAV